MKLDFTDEEKDIIMDSINKIGIILAEKKDSGVKRPQLDGKLNFRGENIMLVFDMSLEEIKK